jgi:hypothetical protein
MKENKKNFNLQKFNDLYSAISINKYIIMRHRYINEQRVKKNNNKSIDNMTPCTKYNVCFSYSKSKKDKFQQFSQTHRS